MFVLIFIHMADYLSSILCIQLPLHLLGESLASQILPRVLISVWKSCLSSLAWLLTIQLFIKLTIFTQYDQMSCNKSHHQSSPSPCVIVADSSVALQFDLPTPSLPFPPLGLCPQITCHIFLVPSKLPHTGHSGA